MKLAIKILIPIALVALMYLYVEGTVTFGANCKVLDKLFGAEIKMGIREIPRTINILR